MEIVHRWFNGDRSPSDLIVRYDPSMTRTIALAEAAALIRRNTTGSIALTATGMALVRSIKESDSVMLQEKEFLGVLPRRMSQRQLRSVMEWR
jgi:hypothetical protein